MILIVGIHTAYAQHELVEKQDGKFFANISVQPYGFGADQNAAGFIKDLELEVTWWWLFDQPVYYHTLRWTIQDSVKVEPYSSWLVFLRREDLSDYPDLLKRFDELRPRSMEITFDVTLYQMEKSKFVGKFDTYFDSSGSFNYRKTVKNIELMIAKSGQDGENLSPGSPEDDFSEFTDYAVKPSFINSKEKVEQRLKNTFINTGSIVFGNAHVSGLELPNQEVKSIYDAFMARERGCPKYMDNPRIWTCGKEEKTVKADDFWNTGGKSDSQPVSEDIADEPSDDFWNNGDLSDKPAQKPVSSASSTDQFWSTGVDGKRKVGGEDFGPGNTDNLDFEIKTIEGKTGVVSASGTTLVPFREWRVISFEGGVAEVVKNVNKKRNFCGDFKREVAGIIYNPFDWSFSGEAWITGFVGRQGEWLGEPKKYVKAESVPLEHSTSGYKDGKTWEDFVDEYSDSRTKRDVQRYREWIANCEAEMDTQMEQYLNKYRGEGYKVVK